MVEISRFFDSVAADRQYSAAEFGDYFTYFMTNGILPHFGNALNVVTGVDETSYIQTGRAFINGHLYVNTSTLTMTHNPTATQRVDRIVLRLDTGTDARNIQAFVKEGGPTTPPALTRAGNIYELSLAQILVTSTEIEVLQDERANFQVCGYVTSKVYRSHVESEEALLNINRTLAYKQYLLDLDNQGLENTKYFYDDFDTSPTQSCATFDNRSTTATSARTAGQTTVPVVSDTAFQPGDILTIYDDVNMEDIIVSSKDSNILTLTTQLAHDYKTDAGVATSPCVVTGGTLTFPSWGGAALLKGVARYQVSLPVLDVAAWISHNDVAGFEVAGNLFHDGEATPLERKVLSYPDNSVETLLWGGVEDEATDAVITVYITRTSIGQAGVCDRLIGVIR